MSQHDINISKHTENYGANKETKLCSGNLDLVTNTIEKAEKGILINSLNLDKRVDNYYRHI